MYNEYFGFREKPFNVTPDPKFFYTNPIYQEAYASLLYGIRERKGFIVVVGEVGTGKTTLLRRLMREPDENVSFVFFYNTTLSFEELVTFACDELDLPVKGAGRLQKIRALNDFLVAQAAKGGTVVLLVDEAQNLNDDVLENLRLLSNLETATEKLLQIVLVGQTELDAKLNQPQLRQIKQRVAFQCRLDRLKDREIGPFIDYRLRVAGYEKEKLFSQDAVVAVATYSRGIPRLINIICDNALLIAYATSGRQISAEMIKEVASDLRLLPPQPEPLSEPVPQPTPAQISVLTPAQPVAREKRAEVAAAQTQSAPRAKTVLRGTTAASLLVAIAAGLFYYGTDLASWLSNKLLFAFGPVAESTPTAPSESKPAASSRAASNGASADMTATAGVQHVVAQTAPDGGAAVGEASARQAVKTSQPNDSVVVAWGTTISRIATEVYGRERLFLAMDILKEANPGVEDLNWILAGQNLSLPPLTRETLLRKQPDGGYHLIVDAFLTPQDAQRLSRTLKSKGYETEIAQHRISNKMVLSRVEIRGLKSKEAADQAWDAAVANRWIVASSDNTAKVR
ncbi:MAG TPA: AAA family ATPase [Candidatus Binatia bacterium]